MLQSAQQLQGFTLGASDGEIGRVEDVYFDDQHWTLRYLVVNTGGWLSERKVLISPISLKGVDWPNERIDVALTRKQVEGSPDIDTDKPVSRQREGELFSYYNYPAYWSGPYIWGLAAYPAAPVTAFPRDDAVARELRARERASADSHLRSGNEVSGYDLEARDGAIGHVSDLLFDDQSWSIRHIVVDTRNWLPGKHVLIAPESIEEVSWSEHSVRVDATREAVSNQNRNTIRRRSASLLTKSIGSDRSGVIVSGTVRCSFMRGLYVLFADRSANLRYLHYALAATLVFTVCKLSAGSAPRRWCGGNRCGC